MKTNDIQISSYQKMDRPPFLPAPKWYHLACLLETSKHCGIDVTKVTGFGSLTKEDQEIVKQKFGEGRTSGAQPLALSQTGVGALEHSVWKLCAASTVEQDAAMLAKQTPLDRIFPLNNVHAKGDGKKTEEMEQDGNAKGKKEDTKNSKEGGRKCKSQAEGWAEEEGKEDEAKNDGSTERKEKRSRIPKNGFELFCKHNRSKVQEANPGIGKHIAVAMLEMWKNLKEESRKKFDNKAQSMRAEAEAKEKALKQTKKAKKKESKTDL